MADIAEDVIVDIEEFRLLLEDKLKPIVKTVDRLELKQEQIFAILANQVAIEADLRHLQKDYSTVIESNSKVHDKIFDVLKSFESKVAADRVYDLKELAGKLEALNEKTGSKLWDVLKLIIASLLGGGVFAWWSSK